jgi:hypothetical protein
MGEEMGPDGLDVAVGRMAEGADGLEILLGSPACRQDWQRQVDLYRRRCHGVCVAGCRRASRERIELFHIGDAMDPTLPNGS